MIDLIPAPGAVAQEKDLLIDIRTLVAKHLGIGVEYITYNSHFSDDLGLDWLDVIELIILVEDQFPDLRVVESVQMASLDELIQHIHFVGNETSENARLYHEECDQSSPDIGDAPHAVSALFVNADEELVAQPLS